MRQALRELSRDAWVIPIAAAAAIAYAVVRFVQDIVAVLVDLATPSPLARQATSDSILGFDNLFDQPFIVRVGDRLILLQPLLNSLVVLISIVVIAGVALRTSNRAVPVELDT